MSALMTLSANSENRLQALLLGIRWATGHSTGLLLVGITFLFITIGRTDDNIVIPDRVSHTFDSIVGVSMIILGIYGIIQAREKIRKNNKHVEIVTTTSESALIENARISHDDSSTASISYGSIEDVEMIGPIHESNAREEVKESNDETKCFSCDRIRSFLEVPYECSRDSSSPDDMYQSDADEVDNNSHDHGFSCNSKSKISTRWMAFFVGVIHGLAGPGGVLGVIPAVQLHDARLSTIYLASFCISSMATMGTVAVLYESCSKFISKSGKQTAFILETSSACLSILVGLLWLILLSVGKLDEVFP